MTSITTAIGFFSLATSSIKPVRDFGIFTGLGILFALAVSITVLPLLISIMKFKNQDVHRDKKSKFLEIILLRIGEFVDRRKYAIIVVSLVLIAVSLTGMFRIESRQVIISMLKDHADLEEAHEFIDFHLGGSCEFGVLIEGDKNSIIEPDNLKVIERLQKHLLENVKYKQSDEPIVRKATSIVDYLKEMNQAIHEDNPDYYKLPSSKEEVMEYLEIYSFNEDQASIDSLVNDDYSKARIRIYTLSAEDMKLARKGFNEMEDILADEVKGTPLKAEYTGRPFMFGNMVDSLIMGMIQSFSFAFIIILFMMIIVFRSFRVGLLSMIVNIIPAIITFGIMGWLNIPLNLVTAMVPSIAIGIAVDDTIHLMWRFSKEIRVDGNYKDAILRSLKTIGKPIVTTSILLCAGFSVFYFSGLTVLTQLGFVTIITVLGALLTDLLLAPALLLTIKPFRSK